MSDWPSDQTRRNVLASSLAAGVVLTGLTDSAKATQIGDSSAIRPFRANIPQEALDDLRRRIAMTRWPDRETVSDRSQGAKLENLQPLARYWGADYDWRRAEAQLNRYPQFITEIDGVEIHFVHVRSRHRRAMPLIMTHGWPGSVFELLKTIGPLTDPTAHGGRAADAFHLVLPTIPGFGFSGKPTDAGWNPDRIARAWAELMRRLGYTSYVAQGGDWGSPISGAMARQAAPGLLGIHINLPATRSRRSARHRRLGAGELFRSRARGFRRAQHMAENRRHGLQRDYDGAAAGRELWRDGFTHRPCTLAARAFGLRPMALWRRSTTVALARRRARQHYAVLAHKHRRFFR